MLRAPGEIVPANICREVVYELRRVVWPSRKETIGSTSVVLVIVMLCGIAFPGGGGSRS